MKKKSIIIYFLQMFFIFIFIDLAMTLIADGIATSSLLYKYGSELITEVFYALIIMIVMLLFKNSYVFTDKKDKFWDGVMLAVPMLVVSIVNFVSSALNIGSFRLSSFINMLIFSVFIGIAEEFLCRGWLQNEFIERYSKNKKQIIVSIILSSLIFGFMHIVNIAVQTPFETILQIINATALGFLLGCVYFKTKNIWSVIFLHSFYDFSIMLGEIDMIKDCSYNTPTIGVTIYESFSILLISALWIIGAIYVINKCEFENFFFKKKNNTLLYGLMGIIFILVLLPFHKYIDGYDNYMVCYTYEEINDFDKYEINYPIFNKNNELYEIEYKENNFDDETSIIEEIYKFKIEKNLKDRVVITNIKTQYEREFDIKDVIGYVVFESNDYYNIAILTDENESTLYYSNSIRKDNISDDNNYIDNIKFEKFVFPEILNLGYIETEDDTYTYLVSTNYDRFVIMDNKEYLIKQK